MLILPHVASSRAVTNSLNFTKSQIRMTVCQVLLSIILLNQLVVRGQDSCSTEGAIREASVAGDGKVLVQYCTTPSRFSQNLEWHYLCGRGGGSTPTLATVVCRELPGYSDQEASLGQTCLVNMLPQSRVFVTLNQSCTGNETRLSECGELTPSDDCGCAEINCQQRVATSDSPSTTTLETDPPTVSQESDTTTTVTDSVSLPTNTAAGNGEPSTPTSQEEGDATDPPTQSPLPAILEAVIGVLVVLVASVFIIACAIVVCKKRTSQAPTKGSSETPQTIDDPVYDDTTPTQPNYSSLGPTFDMETATEPVTYDYIELKGRIDIPATSIPENDNASKKEDDFYDAEEHTYAAVSKKSKKKALKQQVVKQANPTPEKGKSGEDFYDAEDHTYSVVNKKRAKKKTPEDGERERGGEEVD